MMRVYTKQTGAVSLFIVVFTMLLITIVTVSFIRITLQDQQQASNQDLSQSAYDSAQAGVEDGKRAILQYQTICANDTSPNHKVCSDAAAAISSSTCNQGLAGIETVSGSEVKVQQTQSSGDVTLDQAYTCVTINLQTANYLGSLSASASKVIPLIAPAGSSFNTVSLQWFSPQDVGAANNYAVDLLPFGSTVYPLVAPWPANRPSLMRAQLFQVGSSFTLANLDASTPTQSDANTIFLYPSATPSNTTKLFTSDNHTSPQASGIGPQAVTCKTDVSAGGYACSVDLTLPDPINGGSRVAYLRLSALYNKTNYSVTLSNSGAPIKFDGVQPEIDSTGRANDLFRRVQSRVDVTDPAYPDTAVDITSSLCKDFSVTNNTADYVASNACSP